MPVYQCTRSMRMFGTQVPPTSFQRNWVWQFGGFHTHAHCHEHPHSATQFYRLLAGHASIPLGADRILCTLVPALVCACHQQLCAHVLQPLISQHFRPTYDRIAAFFTRTTVQPPIAVCRVDCANEGKLCNAFSIAGYPTMRVARASALLGMTAKDSTAVQGRTLDEVVQWMSKHLNAYVAGDLLQCFWSIILGQSSHVR